MTKSGFDLDEIERRARAFLFQECQPDRGDVFNWMDDRMADFIRYALHNTADAMLTEIRELRAENARLREDVRRQTSLAQDHFRNATRLAARAALGEPQ